MVGRAAAGALLFAISCVRVEAYTCADESECLTRPGGICEPSGYCSYPDSECASHQRYGALAGPNPWNAKGLEWQTASPPPVENFTTIPVVTEPPYAYPDAERGHG